MDDDESVDLEAALACVEAEPPTYVNVLDIVAPPTSPTVVNSRPSTPPASTPPPSYVNIDGTPPSPPPLHTYININGSYLEIIGEVVKVSLLYSPGGAR